ncbi:MAG: hypothetical protein ACJ75F_00800 [Flavisolibacter sp.]|jgi:hypothetical protein
MKKIVICAFAIAVLASCNNSSGNDEPTPTTTNVQNVNGNLPDTTSGSTLNGTLPVDSSKVKDSLKH